jgi:hypothetical protein
MLERLASPFLCAGPAGQAGEAYGRIDWQPQHLPVQKHSLHGTRIVEFTFRSLRSEPRPSHPGHFPVPPQRAQAVVAVSIFQPQRMIEKTTP